MCCGILVWLAKHPRPRGVLYCFDITFGLAIGLRVGILEGCVIEDPEEEVRELPGCTFVGHCPSQASVASHTVQSVLKACS